MNDYNKIQIIHVIIQYIHMSYITYICLHIHYIITLYINTQDNFPLYLHRHPCSYFCVHWCICNVSWQTRVPPAKRSKDIAAVRRIPNVHLFSASLSPFYPFHTLLSPCFFDVCLLFIFWLLSSEFFTSSKYSFGKYLKETEDKY